MRLQGASERWVVADAPVTVSVPGRSMRSYDSSEAHTGLRVTVTMPRVASLPVTLSWEQRSLSARFDAPPCRLTLTVVVPGGFGKLPRGHGFSTIGGPVARINIGSPDADLDCRETADVPLSLHVGTGSPGRMARQLRSPDVCGRTQRSITTKTWTLRQDARQRFVFRAADINKPTRQLFRWVATAGDRVVARGRFVVHRRYFPPRRIWQGTDAFVNVCINRGYTVRSEGGRLYCTVPASRLTFIDRLR
jgi:hypothetical protein